MNPMRTVSAAVLLAATFAAAPAFAATTSTTLAAHSAVTAGKMAAPKMAAPAMAAAHTATMTPVAVTATMAAKADIVPIKSLVDIIGRWNTADLNALGKAKAVKTFDVKSLYPAADQTKVATAEAAKNAELVKLRASLRADAKLNAWFTTNKIDIDHVVAVAERSTGAHVFVY